MLGKQELSILEDGILGRNAYGETKMAWGAIERIESTADHTFLFIRANAAYVIPHARITEGDYRAFMTELAERFQPDRALQSAER